MLPYIFMYKKITLSIRFGSSLAPTIVMAGSGELSLGLLCDIAILIMQATSRLPLGSASSLSVVYLLIDMLVFLPVSYHKI